MIAKTSMPLAKRVDNARRASSWTSTHQQEYIDLLTRYIDELEEELRRTGDELQLSEERNQRYWQRIVRYEQEAAFFSGIRYSTD